MKFKTVLLLLLLNTTVSFSQNYFQQEVNYTINVKLDDVKNELSADESIEYINNSPNELTFIYIHLWANAYKDNATPLAKQLLEDGSTKMYYAKDDELGYIDSLDFKINGMKAKWELLKDSIDICKLFLNEPLKSGGKITITTPFHINIPSGKISRLGHIEQSYQITQWYPKPAVYDRNGWNYIPYLNQGEFYSEFGSFDVSITVPKNYVLGATGDMVDGEKELEWLDEKVKETETIKSYNSKDLSFPSSDKEMKTLRYKQKNVHDFAWFCDKRYHVLKGEVITPHTNHKVTTWAMFTNAEGELWTKSINYINDAIHYYSLWNGDYPYNNCTAVDGTISAGGGMEYPNITVIGGSGNAFQLDVVITHEVGHNWFYGMLGSNERVHAWMDEGINSFNENRYVETKYPEQKLIGRFGDNAVGKAFDLRRYKHKAEYELTYLFSAKKNEDQPIELPAYDYTTINYAGVVYAKTAIVFDYLMAYLGEDVMDKAMQKYFDDWHYKHPMPADFRKVMEESTGKDLSWFFEMINTTKKLDYKICSAKKSESGWDIVVKNAGDIKGPVFLQSIKDNKVVATKIYDGFDGKQTLGFPSVEADYFKIDYVEDMPEINRNNNTIYTKGIFKKVEPLKLQWLASLDNPDRTQLYFTPVVGWNNNNKGMVGLAFYNAIFSEKKFEFQLMPLWSFAQSDVAGYANVTYNIFPKGNVFQKISVSVKGARYDYNNVPFEMNFNKIAPELFVEFKKKKARGLFTHTLKYRYISITQDIYHYHLVESFVPMESYYVPVKEFMSTNYNDLTYRISKKDAVNPYSFNVNMQQSKDFAKASLTANYSYKFKNKNKGIDMRLFAGAFIGDNKSVFNDYRFQLSGATGYNDYLYDNIFLDRSGYSDVLWHQFAETDGAFKFYYPTGSSEWLTSLSVKSSLGNAKIPLNIYAEVGTMADDGIVKDKYLYDAGICISLPKRIFEIYIPLVMCNDFKNEITANGWKFPDTIRFTLNLNLVNPFDLVNKISL